MLNTLLTIIPLDIAATLSPIILALTIFLLSNPNSRARISAFFLASLSVGIFISFIGFNLGQGTFTTGKDPKTTAIIDLILGILFLYFSLKSLLTKERKVKVDNNQQSKKIVKWFAIGFLINITNFDAVFLILTAAKEVGATSLSLFIKLLLLFLNLIFFTLPITLPIFIYKIFPAKAGIILEKINIFLRKYGNYIAGILFLVFSIIFLRKGLIYFW